MNIQFLLDENDIGKNKSLFARKKTKFNNDSNPEISIWYIYLIFWKQDLMIALFVNVSRRKFIDNYLSDLYGVKHNLKYFHYLDFHIDIGLDFFDKTIYKEIHFLLFQNQ